MASPASGIPSATYSPPTPAGPYWNTAQTAMPPAGKGKSKAVGAFVLAMAGTLFAAAGYLLIFGAAINQITNKLGPDATPQQQQMMMQELMAKGELIPREAVICFFIGACLGIAGLVFAVTSLLRQESRRGLAIAACIIGACITFCQVAPVLNALLTRAAGHSP